jgi:hypothetical protein
VVSYPGRILDITADRVLGFDQSGTLPVGRIIDRATNASQIIWTSGPPMLGEYDRVLEGYLIPSGALFMGRTAACCQFPLYEWRDGTLTQLADAIEVGSLHVDRPWAVYKHLTSPSPLIRRNLLTGTNTVVDADFMGSGGDVTPDGIVVDSEGAIREVFKWEPGPPPVTTQLTFGAPDESVAPTLHGADVLFVRARRLSPQDISYSIILREGDGTENVIAENSRTYVATNGWTAFVRGTGFGPQEVWLRALDGTTRQLSAVTGGPVRIALSDTSEVIFEHSDVPDARRDLARPDGTVVDLGVLTGRLVMFDGAWHVLNESLPLAVDTETPARSILSEGATGTFFTTDVAILNPHDSAVPVTIRYLREGAPALEETRTLPALSRTTIHENEILGLEGTSVSTVVEAPGASPVVVERLMSWDASGYGGHLGTSVDHPRPRWLFAEGAGTTAVRVYTVAAGSRYNINTGDISELANANFSTIVEWTNETPITVESAIYWSVNGVTWEGGGNTVATRLH